MSRIRETLSAMPPSARLIATRRYAVWPLLSLSWPLFLAVWMLVQEGSSTKDPSSVLGNLVGLPLVVLACFLGVRIIASECEQRTLEIAYTVPGGPHRIWVPKLFAAIAILLVSELLLAVFVQIFLCDVSLSSLYGALQLALFYLVLAMALSTFFRSVITGALAVVAFVILGFLAQMTPFSPFWNPLAQNPNAAEELFALTIKQRVGFALVTAALVALTFARAQWREKMLS